MQIASPTFAASLDTAAPSDPCDHMGMSALHGQKNGAMPCNSSPCKGTLSDCMQMCLASLSALALPNPTLVAEAPELAGMQPCWPGDTVHTGLSIKPDPFPPKRLTFA